jgi:hypothetical protein
MGTLIGLQNISCATADEEINALGNVFPGILIIIVVICL